MLSRRYWLFGALLPLLSACASVPENCRDILGPKAIIERRPEGQMFPSFVYADAAGEIRHLECEALQGTNAAQVALGKRLETGDGLEKDLARAAALYEKAAASVPARTAIYSPPVRLGGAGQVMMIENSNAGAGSAEAQYRLGLMYLEGRGVERSQEHARHLLIQAANQGHEEARRTLSTMSD